MKDYKKYYRLVISPDYFTLVLFRFLRSNDLGKVPRSCLIGSSLLKTDPNLKHDLIICVLNYCDVLLTGSTAVSLDKFR